MKRAIFIFVVLLVVFFIPNGKEWLLQQGDVARAFLYHFFHGNLFHLLANVLSLYVMIPHSKTWHLASAYAIATLCAFVIPSPMIGISNVAYALIGVRSPSFDSYWWRHPGTLIFFSVTILMLFLPNISGVSHIVSFVVGAVVAIAVRWFKKMCRDGARYA